MTIPIQKRLDIQRPDEALVRDICGRIGCHPAIGAILVNRGITKIEDIQAFLYPSFNHIRSFERLADLDKAVERIARAIRSNEKILVFGDYDVDGVTSTAIVQEFLTATGADATPYIPHRISEGYGLCVSQIENIAIPGGYSLIITIDCGSASHEAVGMAARAGIDVIVTDHHSIYDNPPGALAVVNPKRADCPSQAGYLAGVGVAFCLLIRLRQHLRDTGFWENGKEPNLKHYCDLVALGTIADIVPLVQENRILTRTGLEVINTAPRPGLAALMDVSGLDKSLVDEGDIAFKIAPRLNASGRMEHAGLSLKLLQARQLEDALPIAQTIHAMNARRQAVEQEIFTFIKTYFTHEPENLSPKTIVLGKQGWHPGVLGIVASKLVETYYRPTILISFDNGLGKGSGRGIPGLNLYDALCRCASYLDGFGGHPLAAGLKIRKENLPGFQRAFEETIARMSQGRDLIPTLPVDCVLDLELVSEGLVDELERLQPFGQGNPEPLFAAEDVEVVYSKTLKDRHRRLSIRQRRGKNNKPISAVWFNAPEACLHGNHFDQLLFKLRWNRWNGRKEIQAIIEHP